MRQRLESDRATSRSKPGLKASEPIWVGPDRGYICLKILVYSASKPGLKASEPIWVGPDRGCICLKILVYSGTA